MEKRQVMECNDCNYKWVSRKILCVPCRCPKCNSKNISNYDYGLGDFDKRTWTGPKGDGTKTDRYGNKY